jgi:hypothetical protein
MVGDYQARYDGAWRAGRQEGNGSYHFMDGRLYKGGWKDGKQEG